MNIVGIGFLLKMAVQLRYWKEIGWSQISLDCVDNLIRSCDDDVNEYWQRYKQSGQKLGFQVLKKLSMVGGGNAQKFGQ